MCPNCKVIIFRLESTGLSKQEAVEYWLKNQDPYMDAHCTCLGEESNKKRPQYVLSTEWRTEQAVLFLNENTVKCPQQDLDLSSNAIAWELTPYDWQPLLPKKELDAYRKSVLTKEPEVVSLQQFVAAYLEAVMPQSSEQRARATTFQFDPHGSAETEVKAFQLWFQTRSSSDWE